jgi:hypothetical protein
MALPFFCRFLSVIVDFLSNFRVNICRYYARLLAPFILSPVEKQRKEANNYEGRISGQKGFGQR